MEWNSIKSNKLNGRTNNGRDTDSIVWWSLTRLKQVGKVVIVSTMMWHDFWNMVNCLLIIVVLLVTHWDRNLALTSIRQCQDGDWCPVHWILCLYPAMVHYLLPSFCVSNSHCWHAAMLLLQWFCIVQNVSGRVKSDHQLLWQVNMKCINAAISYKNNLQISEHPN